MIYKPVYDIKVDPMSSRMRTPIMCHYPAAVSHRPAEVAVSDPIKPDLMR
jgi:hypothetical protein